MPPIYRADAVFVLPSLVETQELVLLEAMASGLPVVATDLPAVRGLITHEETGLLVPSRDPGALATAITRLLADPGLRTRLGAAGRAHVRPRFSRDALATRVTDLYAEVTAHARD